MTFRILIAAACGVLFTAALPPTGLWPLALALAPFFGLVAASERAREAFWLGFTFAIAFFSLHVLWLPRSFSELLTPFFWVIFPFMLIALGIYWGGTSWLARIIAGRGRGTLWLLPLLWVLVEWVRAQGLLGFPWGTIGYLWLDTPVAQLADTLGLYGLGLLTAAAMAMLATPFVPAGRQTGYGSASVTARALAPALALALLGGAWIVGVVKLRQPLPAADRTALLVQGDVDPFGRAAGTAEEIGIHAGLSRNGAGDLVDPPDLVVWPEGVVNTFSAPIEGVQGQATRDRIQESSPASAFVVGGSVFEDGRRFNSAFSLVDGQFVDRYDKRFLVPFGERFPLIEAAAPLYRGVFSLLGLPMLLGTFPGDALAPITTPDGPAAVYICYESVFPQVQRVMVAGGARLLINITNDAWFARGDGGRQHFDMGRLRAIETRRWLLRAGNDGITAAVDPKGRVTAELERRVAGTLLVEYGLADTLTPYVRFGGWYIPILAVLTLVMALVVVTRRG